MLRDDVQLPMVLTQLESTLKLDYSAKTVREMLEIAKNKLENSYAIKFDKPLYQLQIDNRFVNPAINTLINDIENGLKSFALIYSLSMYDRNFSQTLHDINYCGYSRQKFLINLKYVQDIDLYDKRGSFFELIEAALDNIPMCQVKKMLIIMLMLAKLDMREGVALIAQYLYIGGVAVG